MLIYCDIKEGALGATRIQFGESPKLDENTQTKEGDIEAIRTKVLCEPIGPSLTSQYDKCMANEVGQLSTEKSAHAY